MSVRITLFAIDRPVFESWLDRPLADYLLEYSRHQSAIPLSFSILTGESVRYETTIEHSIRVVQSDEYNGAGGRIVDELTRAQVQANEFLATRARDYLDDCEVMDFFRLVEVLASIGSETGVMLLSEGYRRWWIGSFLATIQKSVLFTANEKDRLIASFQGILRGYDCGTPLPEQEPTISVFGMHRLSATNDIRVGVWEKQQLELVIRTIHRVAKHKLKFAAPPEPPTVDLTNKEWDEWVYEMLSQLLASDELTLSEPGLISFIG